MTSHSASPPILCPLPRRSVTHGPPILFSTRGRLRTPSLSNNTACVASSPSRRRSSVVGSHRCSIAAGVKMPTTTTPTTPTTATLGSGVEEGHSMMEVEEHMMLPSVQKAEDDVMNEFLSLFTSSPATRTVSPPPLASAHSPSFLTRTCTTSPRHPLRVVARPHSRVAVRDDGPASAPAFPLQNVPTTTPSCWPMHEDNENSRDGMPAGYAWLLGSPISRCKAPAPMDRRITNSTPSPLIRATSPHSFGWSGPLTSSVQDMALLDLSRRVESPVLLLKRAVTPAI